MNLKLIDEMHGIDSESESKGTEGAADLDSDSDTDVDGDGDGDGDGDVDTGPPETDPGDSTSPLVNEAWCGIGERSISNICVAEGPGTASLRFFTDEATSISMGGEQKIRMGVLSFEWSDEHHILLMDLEPGVDTSVEILLSDVNNNSTKVELLLFAQEGPQVAITEILADPNGPEPDQEFIEIVNYGSEEVDLSEWMIDDNGDCDGDVIPVDVVLEPGEVAVLVGTNYFYGEDGDPVPSLDAVVVFLDSSIVSNGLKNSDVETVELYDSFGVLVSSYGGQAGNPVEGKSARRLSAELPDGDELAFGEGPYASPDPGVVDMIENYQRR